MKDSNNVTLFNPYAWLKKVYPNGRPKSTWEVLLKSPPKKVKP